MSQVKRLDVPKVLQVDPSGHDGSIGRSRALVQADAQAMLAARNRRLAEKHSRPAA